MLRLVLSLKHWQIFLLFMTYYFVTIGALSLININLPIIIESFLFGWVPLTIYPLLIGLSLRKYISNNDEATGKAYKAFIRFGIVWMVVFLFSEYLNEKPSVERPWGNEQIIVAILWAAICLVALFKFVQFPSKTINSIELKREAGLWEYIADSFLMWMWPICVFWLQPRINRINDRKLGMR